MTSTYHHLSSEDRAAIMLGLKGKLSMRKLARTLGRSASTISREIRRAGTLDYDATQAAQGYRQRRQKCVRQPSLVPGTALYEHVHNRLVYEFWSPEQISNG